jgi:hypothetical protein
VSIRINCHNCGANIEFADKVWLTRSRGVQPGDTVSFATAPSNEQIPFCSHRCLAKFLDHAGLDHAEPLPPDCRRHHFAPSQQKIGQPWCGVCGHTSAHHIHSV